MTPFWERLTDLETNLPSDGAGIAGNDSGYVVGSWRSVFFSTDGREWDEIPLPFDADPDDDLPWGVNAVAAGPAGFLAVGGYMHEPCTPTGGDGGGSPCEQSPIAWASSDGRTWRSTVGRDLPADGSDLGPYREFASAWPAPGGWEAAVESRDTVLYHGNILLSSPDGLTWSRLDSPPLRDGATSGEEVGSHGAVASTDGRRLAWQTWDLMFETQATTIAMQVDGEGWSEIDGFPGEGAHVTIGLAPSAGDDGPWILAGTRHESFEDGIATFHSAIWYSPDGRTWDVFDAGESREPMCLIRWNDTYVVLVRWHDDGGTSSETLVSPTGESWERPELEVAKPDRAGPGIGAVGPAGLIGIGSIWLWKAVERD